MFELNFRLALILFCILNPNIVIAEESGDLEGLVSVLSSKRHAFSESAYGEQHRCIFNIYQNLQGGHSLEKSMQILPANVKPHVNTIQCLTGSKSENYSTETFIVDWSKEEDYSHIEAQVKAAIHSNIKLYVSVPGEKTVMHEVKSSSQPIVSIDVTPSRATWTRPAHFSNTNSFTITVKTSHASFQSPTQMSTSVLFLLSRDKNFDKTLRKQIKASSKKELVAKRSPRDLFSRKRQNSNVCMRRKLSVDLQKIDAVNRYILHPLTVDVGRCNGLCHPDDVIDRNSSDRGTMLSLYQIALGMTNPLTTCVPQKVAPLSILYVEDLKVKVRHVHDTIIKKCVCE